MAPLVNVQLLAEGFEWPLRHLEQEATSSASAEDGMRKQRHKTGSMGHLVERLWGIEKGTALLKPSVL